MENTIHDLLVSGSSMAQEKKEVYLLLCIHFLEMQSLIFSKDRYLIN